MGRSGPKLHPRRRIVGVEMGGGSDDNVDVGEHVYNKVVSGGVYASMSVSRFVSSLVYRYPGWYLVWYPVWYLVRHVCI